MNKVKKFNDFGWWIFIYKYWLSGFLFHIHTWTHQWELWFAWKLLSLFCQLPFCLVFLQRINHFHSLTLVHTLFSHKNIIILIHFGKNSLYHIHVKQNSNLITCEWQECYFLNVNIKTASIVTKKDKVYLKAIKYFNWSDSPKSLLFFECSKKAHSQPRF